MSTDNVIYIKSTVVGKNRIDIDYEVKGDWAKCFNLEKKFFIEYSCDISSVPESIAVVPLLGNILPIAWICNAKIHLPVIDRTFYESIPEFKQGYIEMHKAITFKGEILPDRIEDNSYDGAGSLALFSGGVDAFNTLVCHMGEKPSLVTLWGSDVMLDDVSGWHVVQNHVASVCNEFDLNGISVKSNFREIIDADVLSGLVRASGDGWWHGFQHGIGIIAHTAPIAYALKKAVVYIASSFTIAEKGISCASDPTIDNFVRFGSTKVVHDGYEFNRQMKIANISNYVKQSGKPIRLHVCWQSRGGENCCYCEKCLRTIVGLYANGDDPRKFGFNYSDFNELTKYFKKRKYLITSNIISRWGPIQEALLKNYRRDNLDPNLRWLCKADLEHFKPYSLTDRAKSFIKRALSRVKRQFLH